MEQLERATVIPPGAVPVPGSAHERFVEERQREVGRFGFATVADHVSRHADSRPEADAYVTPATRMTWREYDQISTDLAGVLVEAGVERGDRVAVLLPDGPLVHAAFVAVEKAGGVVLGIGPRAALLEIAHLVAVAGARFIVTLPDHRGVPTTGLVESLRDSRGWAPRHVLLDPSEPTRATVDGGRPRQRLPDRLVQLVEERRLGVGDVWLLNSTSGTTGMPKCVVHTQHRWACFHDFAVEAGTFGAGEVFMGLIPAPFGFGIWTAHTTPAALGCPTVVLPEFSAEGALEMIERERATVLCCVTTQFVMMLNSPALDRYDLTSLRVMFTGGEAVPKERSAEFEDRTGCQVLQFYGSNETGALSRTTTRDSRERRLTTAGRVLPDMDVRLLDDEDRDVTTGGGPGQAACRGPATSLGYYGDAAANEELITEDGWMVTGDVCTVDEQGYLTVVGRKADFIIRGGKNISAVAVEEQVASHPDIAMAAAVAMPDDVFGERVCAYVVPRPGASPSLADVVDYLERRGVTKEMFPERLELVEDLPRSSGGKVAKGQLRADIRRRMGIDT